MPPAGRGLHACMHAARARIYRLYIARLSQHGLFLKKKEVPDESFSSDVQVAAQQKPRARVIQGSRPWAGRSLKTKLLCSSCRLQCRRARASASSHSASYHAS